LNFKYQKNLAIKNILILHLVAKFAKFNIGDTERKETRNPLGVKGCGEVEAIAEPPTVMNDVIDDLGGQEVNMTATAEKVWKACKNLKKSNAKAA